MKIVDLHTHSNYSDGSFTPSELIDAAVTEGIAAIALCDHNTIDGIDEFMEAATGKDIKAIPGIEISSNFMGKELHILGLFISRESFGEIMAVMKKYDVMKEESNIVLVERLCKSGYPIDYSSVKASTPKGHVNRVHIAEALLEKGFVSSVDHAFNTILSREYGLYSPPERLPALEAVTLIKKWGGVAVLAHPFLKLNCEELCYFLSLAVPLGLDGMEIIYPLFDEETRKTAKNIADRFALLYSGGSDFHGSGKPHIKLGRGMDNMEVSFEYYEKLCQRAKSII